MAITSDVLRGHTQTIILAHLLNGDSYGYQINREIAEKTGKTYELKEATLYSAFRRMEKDELIESYWGDEDSGARRRYYKITEKGRENYFELRKDWDEAKLIIESLIISSTDVSENKVEKKAKVTKDKNNEENGTADKQAADEKEESSND